MEQIVDRKPIFDAVRLILGRGFSHPEVERIDRAIDSALGRTGQEEIPLGALSARFESGGRGPGTVSSGAGDPGGVSYGLYQLSSRAGTAAAFIVAEGKAWQDRFGGAAPGTEAFGAAWRAIADADPESFGRAQHAFIERTHYRPVVASVHRQTALDLGSRHRAVRDATWSTAVQHGGAAKVLVAAITGTDRALGRDDPGFDRLLVEAIYAERSAYVLALSARTGSVATRRTLQSVARSRYPAELSAALALFDALA